MLFTSVKRSDTFFYNDFLRDYLEGDRLEHLRSYSPHQKSIISAINGKESFSDSQRNILADDLCSQYKKSDISIAGSAVSENIEKLRDRNSYTVTTGQQIHIGLGPLYVLYKIFDVLANTAKLSKEHPSYNFIPVFWMASEDHDLDEIREISVFGKKFFWETDQSGPVGRMNPKGVPEMFERIKEEFQFSNDQLSFIDVCISAYGNSDSLANSFRKILHHYFESTGLVVIDADSKNLKSSFTAVLSDELSHQNYEALKQSTDKLEMLGYKKQLVIRECNLFKIQRNDRTKVSGNEGCVSVTNEEAYNLSPNAALRPFYQEWILPNILYIGGQSEVRYWMQLKGIFDNYQVPMPIVQLRTSAIILPKKQHASLGIDDMAILFKSDSDLSQVLNDEYKTLNEALQIAHGEIEDAINKYASMAKNSLNGFTLDGKIKKIMPKLTELNTITNNQLLRSFKSEKRVQKALKVKSKYFDKQEIQERSQHVLGYVDLLDNYKFEYEEVFGLECQHFINIFIF